MVKKITVYPDGTYEVSGFGKESGRYNEELIKGEFDAIGYLKSAKKLAKKLGIEIVSIEAVQCSNASGQPQASVDGDYVAVRYTLNDKEIGVDTSSWKRPTMADGSNRIADLKPAALAQGILIIAAYFLYNELRAMEGMAGEANGEKGKGWFRRTLGF